MKPCELCDGTGESQKWNESSGVYHDCPCAVCDGTGKAKEDDPMIEQFDASDECCPECDGEGCDPDGFEPCEMCDGTGFVPGDEEVRGACPECHGSGCEMCVPEVQSESTDFDKFMHVTLLKESCLHTQNAKIVSPQRQMARNYQENPLGRIRMGAKR